MEKKREPVKLTVRQISQLNAVIKYSNRYEISIQFWPDQTAVFIAKDSVDLTSFGGDFDHAINSALSYLYRINRKSTNDL